VYTPHFEHVEGATSPLWVAVHFLLYKITAHPEANPLDEKQTPDRYQLSVLQGLMNEQRFRDHYRPVLMHLGDAEIFAYARADFIDAHGDDPRIVPMAWERFRPPPPTAPGLE
jgi:hypothetical protein